MVNKNSEDPFDKLSKLSSQERKVLELRCEGLDYKTIGAQLYVSESAVKQYMSRVYVKLGLDLLPRAERMKAIYQTYCPLLDKVEPPVETNEPEPPISIPVEVVDMVDEDENEIVLVQPQSVKLPERTTIDAVKKPPRRWVWLTSGLALGICLTGSIALGIGLFMVNAQQAKDETATTQALVAMELTQRVTLTPVPELPTQNPEIIQQIIVITATTAPTTPATEAPTLTAAHQSTSLFADDFDQGLSGSWNVLSGDPVVVNGQLTADKNSWLQIGDNTWTDYTVQLDILPAECWLGDNWNAIGVRVQDSNNMIALKWANCEYEWDVVKDGIWTTVPNSPATGAYIGNTTLTITVQGNQFSFDLNDQRVSSFFNSDFKQGGVAIRVGAKTQIDNLKVTAIQ